MTTVCLGRYVMFIWATVLDNKPRDCAVSIYGNGGAASNTP